MATLELSSYKSFLTDQFVSYVRIDTQSDFHSSQVPSTEKQKNLGRLLLKTLRSYSVESSMDENGYVYGKIPANVSKNLPKIFFCAHMDTSPDCSGTDVKPRIHDNYQGDSIYFPNSEHLVLNPEVSPKLADKVGHDIITASGDTLLGADNKSGIAAIMTAVKYIHNHPEMKHGPVRILFTPDEEIGRGVDHLDAAQLDADFGYTMDGEELGSFNWETFSADYARVAIHGVSTHPGYGKDKLLNALKLASYFIDQLPNDGYSPETTENKEPFIHPVRMEGQAEKAELGFILRDFDTSGLNELAKILEKAKNATIEKYPEGRIDIQIEEQYRNMKDILVDHPQIVDFGIEAIERSGLKPKVLPIRGGTDGSRLSYMNLPCPNIFVGEYHFHSPLEWTSIQDMLKSAETILHLISIWYEKG